MLEALMKFGGYKVDRFFRSDVKGKEFGFYVRSDAGQAGGYCAAAKHQLYYGLALLYARGEIHDLVGVYIDIAALDDLQRPAYMALKRDALAGHFQRVLVVSREALLGSREAERDLVAWARGLANGLELFTFQAGEPEVISCGSPILCGTIR